MLPGLTSLVRPKNVFPGHFCRRRGCMHLGSWCVQDGKGERVLRCRQARMASRRHGGALEGRGDLIVSAESQSVELLLLTAFNVQTNRCTFGNMLHANLRLLAERHASPITAVRRRSSFRWYPRTNNHHVPNVPT